MSRSLIDSDDIDIHDLMKAAAISNLETEIRASTSRAIETQTENTDEHKHEESDHCRQYSARHFWTNFNKDDEDSSLTDTKVKSLYPSYEDIEKQYFRFFMTVLLTSKVKSVNVNIVKWMRKMGSKKTSKINFTEFWK
ncbi:hypothetical protein Btru_048207 [Bulinus truncatus]|nr:hypothetical protein Btru_048207 [Bulinus truncatus]